MSNAAKRPILTAYYTCPGRTGAPARFSHSVTLAGAHAAASRRLFAGHYVKAVIYAADYGKVYTLTRRVRQLRTTGDLP